MTMWFDISITDGLIQETLRFIALYVFEDAVA